MTRPPGPSQGKEVDNADERGLGPLALAFDSEDIWVANAEDGTVSKVSMVGE